MDLIDARFGAYVAVSALLIVTPGPDMALVTRNALRGGRSAATYTAFGVAAGILLWAVASVIGIGVLLERSIVAFTVLKVAGALYLGYLGVRNLISGFRKGGIEVAGVSAESSPLSRSSAMTQGLLGNVLNPKAGVIFVSVVPQFVSRGDSPVRLVLMLLAFETILLLWLNLYGSLISRAGRSRAGVRIRAMIDRLTGAVLLALGLRLLLNGSAE